MTDENYDTITEDDKNSIKKLLTMFHRRAREKGFHETGDKVRELAEEYRYTDPALSNYLLSAHRGNRLMLMVGELTEAHDEIRKGQHPGYLYTSVTDETAEAKPEGWLTEMVDELVRLGDTVGEENLIDAFVDVLVDKVNFNAKRPHKNGKEF